MQEHIQFTQKEINRDLLSGVLSTPKWWPPLTIFLLIVFLTGVGAFGYMLNKGVGVTGLNRPVMWGFFMTNFVFWIGISHAGVMLSAILRLSKAEWRRPATRAAEVLTIFSLMTAVTMPIIHTGRPWRTLY
ncbi:MAG: polysulfide reductase NrfD, partial [Chloroflexi bacterium]|nr:polysulfide reductase NrfD [Chloroflexota bacterium]